MSKKPYVIGISGKIGAGKNYLANKLSEYLHQHGFSTGETSYATPLKTEVSHILEHFRAGETNKEIAEFFNIPEEQVAYLRSITHKSIKDPNVTGWSRSEEIRQALQYHGTEIRRAQKYDYWVDQIENYFDDVDFMFIVDVRFPNEADKIHSLEGTLIRVDVPDEVILQRVSARDGLKYSQEALNHKSEKALNDYTNWHLVVGETYDVAEIAKKFLT